MDGKNASVLRVKISIKDVITEGCRYEGMEKYSGVEISWTNGTQINFVT